MNSVDYIRKLETLGHVSDNAFDIAFGVDANFVPPMGIMLTSLARNNPDRDFRIHVFYNSINDEDSARLRTFAAQHDRMQLELYHLESAAFAALHVEKGYTSATYDRILIAQYLYPTVERLLYIDADTLCVGRLNELTELDFGDKILFAVPDQGQWVSEHRRNFGFAPGEIYYNSGVLYIDLRRWNEFDLSDKMMTMLRENELSMQDQDALNLIARHLIQPLPVRFNQFLLLKEPPVTLPEDTIIVHFAGQLKPWQPWCEHPQRAVYDEYRARSLWREFDYSPRDYQEERLMGRALRRRGQWCDALRHYFRYVRRKFFK